MREGITVCRNNGRVRLKGISQEAKRLGVTRGYLYKVCKGKMQSERILNNIRARVEGEE